MPAREILQAWSDARTPEALARAEDAIRGASVGAIETAWTADVPPADAIAPAGAETRPPLEAEAAWLRKARIAQGGLRCTKTFGALGTPARAERLAHIAFDPPLRHPTIDAHLRLVPVAPPALRPPVVAEGVLGAPAIDAHLAWLVRWASILNETPGAAESEAIVAPVVATVQQVLESATRWVTDDALPASPAAGPARDELRLALSGLALDGDHLVADSGQLAVLDLASGTLRRFDSRGARLAAIAKDTFLLTTTEPFVVEKGELEIPRFYALDARDGRWKAWPEDAPRVAFEEAGERSYLVRDDGGRAHLHEAADYPVTNVFSPCGRFAWVEDKEGSGGVFRVRDAAHVATFPQGFEESLEPDVQYVESAWSGLLDRDEDGDDEALFREAREAGRGVAAIAKRADGFVTFRNAVVARNGVPWFALNMAVDAAAFDAAGERLAVHSRPMALYPPMLVVFDLRGDEPVVSFEKALRG